MHKGWLFGGLAALALTSALWAREGVVHLKDGTPLAGEVDESDPQQVIVSSHGIQETVPRTDIESIDYPGNLDEQYAARMDKLAAGDINGRLTVASWARAAGRYDLARSAVAEALAIDPANSKALDLMHDINVDAALGHHAATRHVTAIPASQPTTRVGEKPYLTYDQINTLRQIELKPDDAFRVTFAHDVRKRFLDLGTTDARTFYGLSLSDQARQILAAANAALSADVRIETDPASLAEFHTRILPFVLGGCAVSGCHSPVRAAGGFGLFTGDESPRAWYTNFYILQCYSRPPTSAGAAEKLMINRSQPEQSLLLDYAMLPALAAVPHPPAHNYRPIFPGRNDARYQSFLHWITVMLRPDAGSYPGIDYRPPWAADRAAATRPAAQTQPG